MRPLSLPRLPYLILGLLTLLYLLLPTRNSTLDAWYYAACVRHQHELFLPHHLLYNAAGWLWVQLGQGAGLRMDTLAALKAMNALAAGGCLVLLQQILWQLGLSSQRIAAGLLLVGSSFGLLRFATENEAYVLPLLFSLAGSLCWVQYQLGAAPRVGLVVWAGFWAMLACLFHQIHVFWWLGLLAGTGWYARQKGRDLLLFASPALLVPLAYSAALAYWHEPLTIPALWRFVFHDYYAGTAGGSLSAHSGLLTTANLVRTFLQVHGSLPALVRVQPLLMLVALFCAGLLALAGFIAWQARPSQKPAGAVSPPSVGQEAVFRVHALILGLQLAFAAYSEGNAEFMVMLPALLAVAGSRWGWLPVRSLAAGGAALLLWNLAFGLIPAHYLRFVNTDTLLLAVPAQPHDWFLLDNPNLVLNQLHYRTGNPVAPANVLPAPTLLVQRPGWSAPRLQAWVREQQRGGRRVFTDALGGPHLFDRAQLVYGDQNAALLAGFPAVRRDSLATFFGPRYLTEILAPPAGPAASQTKGEK